MRLCLARRGWVFLILAAARLHCESQVSGGAGAFELQLAGMDVRAMGLGSATAPMAADLGALDLNPAGLALLRSPSLSAQHRAWLGDLALEGLSLSLPLGRSNSLGIASSFAIYPEIEVRDEADNPAGSLRPQEQSLSLAFARSLSPGLAIGLQAQALRMDLVEASYLQSRAGLGLLWSGAKGLKFGAEIDSQPGPADEGLRFFNASAGLSYESRLFEFGSSLFAASWRQLAQSPSELRVALEQSLGADPCLSLRGGWAFSVPAQELGDLYGLSAGVGFRVGAWSMDYAFVPFGEAGQAHGLSLSYAFGNAPFPSRFRGEEGGALPKQGVGERSLAQLPAGETSPLPPPSDSPPSPPLKREERGGVDLKLLSDDYLAAESLEKSGKTKEALLAYAAAVEKRPKDRASWKALARLYTAFGRRDYARACYEHLVVLDPKDTESQQALMTP